MVLPRIYRQSGEAQFATYDFYDLATGTGYKTFYLVDVVTGTDTRDYLLVTNAIGGWRGYVADGNPFTTDFDLTFEVSTKIEGDIYFQLWFDVANNYELKVNLYHVDKDGAETAIGTTQELNATAGDNRCFSGFVNTDLVTFKPNEKFRFTFTTTSTQANCYIFCDPLNRTSLYTDGGGGPLTTAGSQSLVNLPIKIQQ